jgi:hypothetical protein
MDGTEIHVQVVKGLYEKYRIREVTVNEWTLEDCRNKKNL